MPPTRPDQALPSPIWGKPPARETVSAAAYQRLRDAILHGQVSMGARINELELAGAWGVSRTPIRDALRRLEAEGLVQAVAGRGMVVPRLDLADADDLYDLREVLEGRAARRAAERATPELHARLNTLIKAFGAAHKQGNLDEMIALDIDFHASLAAASGSARLQRAIETAHAQVYQVRLRTMRARGRPGRSLRELARLVAAVRARDGARAETAMREHIASVRSDLPAVMLASAT